MISPLPSLLLEVLGRHPARRLGLAFLELDEHELQIWLRASSFFDGRLPDDAAVVAWSQLALLREKDDKKLYDLSVGLLRAAEVPAPETRAALFVRLGAGLSGLEGGLVATLQAADELASLGAALLPLAPGFGQSALVRFLRPLRPLLPVLDELPADPAAVHAAVHLGLLGSVEQAGDFAAALSSWVAKDDLGPEITVDLEAALERLGKRACRRKKAACPLEGQGCPRSPG